MASNGVIISAENRGPWIVIVTWILGAIMCLATFIKVLSKRIMSQKTQYDDVYVVAAMVYSSIRLASHPRTGRLTPATASGNWLRYHDLNRGKSGFRATFTGSECWASPSLPAGQ